MAALPGPLVGMSWLCLCLAWLTHRNKSVLKGSYRNHRQLLHARQHQKDFWSLLGSEV